MGNPPSTSDTCIYSVYAMACVAIVLIGLPVQHEGIELLEKIARIQEEKNKFTKQSVYSTVTFNVQLLNITKHLLQNFN
jgi:hypothetical protein